MVYLTCHVELHLGFPYSRHLLTYICDMFNANLISFFMRIGFIHHARYVVFISMLYE